MVLFFLQSILRTLSTDDEVLRVRRYSERDGYSDISANTPSAASVSFESKAVSRRHCEFSFEQGKWYVKDTKSKLGNLCQRHTAKSAQPGVAAIPS